MNGEPSTEPASLLGRPTMCRSLGGARSRPAKVAVGACSCTKLLSRRGIRRLPVVSKTGKRVGIIALDDLLMLLGSELGHIASALASEPGRSRI